MLGSKDDILRYIETLFGKDAEGFLVIFESSKAKVTRTRVMPYSQRALAAELLANQPPDVHFYLALALHDSEAYKKSNRWKHTAIVLPALVLDVDLLTGIHAAVNLPADPEIALKLIEKAGLPPPTLVVHSGGGLYAIWMFDEPFIIRTPEDRERISTLWEAWGQKANVTWVEHGLKLDTQVCELARVFRPVGTFNVKGDEPQPVVMLSEDLNRRWTVEEFEAMVPASERTPAQEGGRRQQLLRDHLQHERFSNSAPELAQAATGALSMLRGCAFLQHCDENAETLSEQDWWHEASLYAHVKNGDAYFHKNSIRHPDYSHREAQYKLDRAKEFPPKLCETIAKDFPGCATCVPRLAGVLNSPTKFATSTSPELATLQRRFALDAKTGLLLDPETGRDKTKDDFDRSFTRDVGTLASTEFRNSRMSCIVDQHDYIPGDDRLIIQDGAWKRLNMWRDGGIPTAQGDASLWLAQHLPYMFPDEGQLKWILQYFAHLVQFPAIKIKSAILIQSDPGVGKNMLASLFIRMLHDRDVRVLYGGILGERWQAPMGNTRLLVLDELQIDDLKNAYNRLKRWATEEYAGVERKNVDHYDVRTPRGIIVFTNHGRPIAIDKKDRRFFIGRVEAAKRDPDYYRTLATVGLSDDVVAAVRYELQHFDLTGFNPHEEPPMTEAKLDLISVSGTAVEQEIQRFRDDGAWPFDRPVYSIDEVVTALKWRTNRTETRQRIEAIVKGLGDRKLGPRVSVRSGPANQDKVTVRTYPWAWKEHERWHDVPEDELRAAFNGELDQAALLRMRLVHASVPEADPGRLPH